MTPYLYFFRGTTIEYKGNNTSIALPCTCTSSHPVKALWFALECFLKYPSTAVVYCANAAQLSGIDTTKNWFADIESEVALQIAPLQFYSKCEGYIHVADFQKVLFDFGVNTYRLVRSENLTDLCLNTGPLSTGEIDLIVGEVRKYLKK